MTAPAKRWADHQAADRARWAPESAGSGTRAMTATIPAAAKPVSVSARRRSKRMATAITSSRASGTIGLRDAPVTAARARMSPVSRAVVAQGVQAGMLFSSGTPRAPGRRAARVRTPAVPQA